MPTARIATSSGVQTGEYSEGTVSVDGEIYAIKDDDVELLPPCEARNVYCLGRNYQDYVDENADIIDENLSHEAEIPDEIDFFLKNQASVISHGSAIPYPTFTDSVGYGGELTAVIDTTCKDVDVDDAREVIRGYTIMNDLTAKNQSGITKIKVFDGSAPLGPAIADVDPFNLEMQTTINGDIRQRGTTEDMYYGPYEAVSEISRRVTLYPGDVIAMGSPANPGSISPGDEIEVWYEGIGTLRNRVVDS